VGDLKVSCDGRTCKLVHNKCHLEVTTEFSVQGGRLSLKGHMLS
jgi:hypothetical protein